MAVFTEQRWGPDQRRKYRALFAHAFAELISFSRLGQARPEYGAGIRGYRLKQHVIIYEATATALIVVRILHTRRDIEAEVGEVFP